MCGRSAAASWKAGGTESAGMYPGGACSDLALAADPFRHPAEGQRHGADRQANENQHADQGEREVRGLRPEMLVEILLHAERLVPLHRSEEHTSELPSQMRISY